MGYQLPNSDFQYALIIIIEINCLDIQILKAINESFFTPFFNSFVTFTKNYQLIGRFRKLKIYITKNWALSHALDIKMYLRSKVDNGNNTTRLLKLSAVPSKLTFTKAFIFIYIILLKIVPYFYWHSSRSRIKLMRRWD